MSGNFVLWNVTSDEADEIMTLSQLNWSAIAHEKNTPMDADADPENPETAKFPGWTEETTAVYDFAVKNGIFPKLRDLIPPHQYLQYKPYASYLAAQQLLIKNGIKNKQINWVSRLELIPDDKGGWAVKTPSKEVLDFYTINDKANALLSALKIGGVSIEIYEVDDKKIGS